MELENTNPGANKVKLVLGLGNVASTAVVGDFDIVGNSAVANVHIGEIFSVAACFQYTSVLHVRIVQLG